MYNPSFLKTLDSWQLVKRSEFWCGSSVPRQVLHGKLFQPYDDSTSTIVAWQRKYKSYISL